MTYLYFISFRTSPYLIYTTLFISHSMEAGAKAGMDGVSGSRAGGAPVQQFSHCVLRFAAMVVTLVAAVVVAVAKQTETVSVVIAPTLPALAIEATAKSSYSSAFVFFVGVNSIACAYSALSLAISIAKKGNWSLGLLITAMDIVMLSLLFSGLGAAAAIGVVGEQGIPKVGWNKVCNVYGKFCAHVIAGCVVSFLGSVFYLVLVLLTVIRLYRMLP